MKAGGRASWRVPWLGRGGQSHALALPIPANWRPRETGDPARLADDAAVEAVTLGPDGVAAGLREGAVHCACSIASIGLTARLTAAHAERGQGFLSTPVLGRPPAAASATLFVMAAGAADTLEQARPVLEAMGHRLFVVGGEGGEGGLDFTVIARQAAEAAGLDTWRPPGRAAARAPAAAAGGCGRRRRAPGSARSAAGRRARTWRQARRRPA